MRESDKHTDARLSIDNIQYWFQSRNNFWKLISVSCLILIIVLQILVILLNAVNPHIRDGLYAVLVPLLLIYIISIFWRGSTPTILSLIGGICLYTGMFFVYANAGFQHELPSQIANRLGYGLRHEVPPADTVAEFYFLMGIIALVMCMIVSFRPSTFRAKGSAIWTPYPVWDKNHDTYASHEAELFRLIPVLNLLSYREAYIVSRYKYIQVSIFGKIHFVSPDDWVPYGSIVIREENSGLLLGIPKVPDGFNVW